MRGNNLISGTLIGCLIFFACCSHPIGDGPQIIWISPQADQSLNGMKDLSVDIYIEDDVEVDTYEIWMRSGSGFDYFHDRVDIQSIAKLVEYRFVMPTALPEELSIRIAAWDDEGNVMESELVLRSE